MLPTSYAQVFSMPTIVNANLVNWVLFEPPVAYTGLNGALKIALQPQHPLCADDNDNEDYDDEDYHDGNDDDGDRRRSQINILRYKLVFCYSQLTLFCITISIDVDMSP